MRNYLKSLFGKQNKAPAQSEARANILQPDENFCAVGDVHGCLDQLKILHGKITALDPQPVVFIGDYIDRGPDAAGTLDYLFTLSQNAPDQTVCLMGNHEKMMCDFVDDPLGRGLLWLRNGGIATLESYGISGISAKPDPDEAMDACSALEAAMPDEILSWVRDLPLSWHSGNIWCVHAAMNPARPAQQQRSETLLWGSKDFMISPRDDDVCVVHGHTIVDAPQNANSRIAIDTGAYKTGKLTAAQISARACTFLST